MLSMSKKFALLLNSSISVKGQAGAVEALKGSNQEQSKNSSSSALNLSYFEGGLLKSISPKVSLQMRGIKSEGR